MILNSSSRKAFDQFYAKYAPLCYGLALNKLADKVGAEEILRTVFLKLQSEQLVVGATEISDKEICRKVQQEIRSYKRRRVLRDLFACRTATDGSSVALT